MFLRFYSGEDIVSLVTLYFLLSAVFCWIVIQLYRIERQAWIEGRRLKTRGMVIAQAQEMMKQANDWETQREGMMLMESAFEDDPVHQAKLMHIRTAITASHFRRALNALKDSEHKTKH